MLKKSSRCGVFALLAVAAVSASPAHAGLIDIEKRLAAVSAGINIKYKLYLAFQDDLAFDGAKADGDTLWINMRMPSITKVGGDEIWAGMSEDLHGDLKGQWCTPVLRKHVLKHGGRIGTAFVDKNSEQLFSAVVSEADCLG